MITPAEARAKTKYGIARNAEEKAKAQRALLNEIDLKIREAAASGNAFIYAMHDLGVAETLTAQGYYVSHISDRMRINW